MIIISLPGFSTAGALLGDFLLHVGRSTGRLPSVQRVLREATAERARGTCAVAVDAVVYQVLAGMPEHAFLRTAEEWCGRHRARPDWIPAGFDPRTVALDPVVVVGDAPTACLRPLAAAHGFAHVLGGAPATDGYGLLTGTNAAPTVGPDRLRRVRQLLADHGVDPRRCTAFGGDSADADLLELVGNPVVTGDNAYLRGRVARSRTAVVPAPEKTDAAASPRSLRPVG